jgi:hypothetical protein
MNIEVLRQCGAICTMGEMLIDGKHECWTMEDVVRPIGEKVFGETAIPYGTYHVIINYSPHFKRDLPLLVAVPNFEGVRIHPGNTVADTEGCLLVGLGRTNSSVTQSRLAFNTLFTKIRAVLSRNEAVTITYK